MKNKEEERLLILHLLPLEYYPPVTNLIDFFSEKSNFNLFIISTYNNKNLRHYENAQAKIKRFIDFSIQVNRIKKILLIFKNIFSSLIAIVLYRPDIILYYEPHSSYLAFLYTKLLNKKVRLFIHNHEYYSAKDFLSPQMKLVSYYHDKEISYLYNKAEWISQTNTDRLKFFYMDNPKLNKDKLNSLANYPSQTWLIESSSIIKSKKTKLLYIGSLSFNNTYIKEIIDFVCKHQEKFSLDIYSYNSKDEIRLHFQNHHYTNIKFHNDGIEYQNIPKLAKAFDVGLIIYKGHNTNYLYNAPNKLFEYLACGLDVWFPKSLKGPVPYITKETYPQVLGVDFNNLKDFNYKDAILRNNLKYKPSHYFFENEYIKILHKMVKSN